MMSKTVVFLILSVFLFSCKESVQKPEVERLSLTPEVVICDSLESMMPGSMYLAGEYLLWTDPFSNEFDVHIVDIKTGREVGKMVKKGEGPQEFVSPQIAVMPDNTVFVYDLFADRSAVFSITECLAGREPIIKQEGNTFKDVTSLIYMKDGKGITFSPSENKPFRVEEDKPFGKLPFEGEISNSYDHFQGVVKYNPCNGFLFYSTFKMPYFALYKKEGKSFKLEKEELLTDECSIKDNNLLYSGSKRGPLEATLTADYIVTVDTDPELEPVDYFKIGLDYNKLPHSLCVYDYKLNLRKVINLAMPVVRLASSPDNNTLFLLGVNPDFTIYKIEL